MPPTLLALLLILALLGLGAASAFFSAAETALFALRGPQIDTLRRARRDDQELIAGFLARPRRLLAVLLVGDTLANLPLCLLCLLLLGEQAPRWLHADVPRWAAAPVLFAVVVGVCDLVPKLLALKRPEPFAAFAVGVLRRLRPVLVPVGEAVDRWGERLADLITPRPWRDGTPLTAEELETLAELACESGTLRGAEGLIVSELLKIGDKTAKDCMTPRVDAFALPDDLSEAEAAARIRHAGRRLVLVYGDTPDDVLGVLDAMEFLSPSSAPAAGNYVERLLPPSFVPETMSALSLLRAFLTRRQSLAVVVDEYGNYEGIVTATDMIEEILGEALPGGEEEPQVEENADGSLLVGGQARLDELGERLGVPLEREGLDTLGGLIANQLGHVPRAGASLALPGGWRAVVRRSTRRRVELVLLEQNREENREDGGWRMEDGSRADNSSDASP